MNHLHRNGQRLGKHSGSRLFGFTLVELLCCTAIVGAMAAISLPAIQLAREKARQNKCANNMRTLAFGHLKHESAKGGFLPMAKFWWDSATTGQSPGYRDAGVYPDASPRPGAWYGDHGWYFPLMPYIEKEAVLALGDPNQPASAPANYALRTMPVTLYACPSDLGLQRNEFDSLTWAKWRGNYLVNAGNTVYGQHDLPAPCPGGAGPDCWFGGAPFSPIKVTPLKRITDGTGKTLMMSEALVLPENGPYWGGPYSENQVAMGGQTFTGWHTPNSESPDALARMHEWISNSAESFLQQGIALPIGATPYKACGVGLRRVVAVEGKFSNVPLQDSSGVKQQCISARSHHVNGVNAARCNGSVGFFRDSIDPRVWMALTTAWAGDLHN